MRHLNKIASLFGIATIGLMSMTSCESGDLYTINGPDWMADRIDSIANSKGEEDPILYTVGETDFSTGWWAKFSHYYQIEAGKTWEAEFDLYINPDATNTYKNFALIITNDIDRGGAGYKEYGAIRYDHQPSGNSEWGDLINRDLVTSNLTFETDTDAGVNKLGGHVKLTVDRSNGGLYVKMDNGTVVKIYDQTEPLANLNPSESNTKIRCFLVPEGSYFSFRKTNIVSIEDAPDAEPTSIVLSNVPDEILLGSVDQSLAGMKAAVTFASGASAAVSYSDLNVTIFPDTTSYGLKTIVVNYNKTSKGNNCTTPVQAIAETNMVDKLSQPTTILAFPQPVVLGLEDNTTPWWAYFTDNIKVERRQTVVVSFTNYSNCINNWNNFCIILNAEDVTKEYAVVRADNYGWGDGYGACAPKMEEGRDWDTWRAAMDGAKVTVSITNNSNGTADIKAEMLGNDGVLYTQEYIGINGIDKDDLYFRFVNEGSHLVFDTKEAYTITVHPTPSAIGADDNSTPWWSEFTDNIRIAPFQTVKSSFTNYTSGLNNWNNFCVILNGAALNEYCVVRSDNYGWGAGYDGNEKLTHEGTQGEWATWLAAMDGAEVTVAITNNGNGLADIDIEMEGKDGVLYEQYYHNILVDAQDLYFRYVVDGSHMVFK